MGNVPDALGLMTPATTLQNRNVASTTRTSLEAGLAITQVLDAKSLILFRYTRSHLDGYLTDPYKLVSVVNDQFGTLGATQEYRFEKRPDERDIDAFYLAYKRQIGPGILDLSYRYITDSWELESNTVEFRYRYPLSHGGYLQPKLRLYGQSGVSFYRHSIATSEGLPDYVSADARLAEFDAMTIGLTYGRTKANVQQQDSGFRVVGEYYVQQGESYPDDAVGLQSQQNLFPTFHAFVVKLVYSTVW